MEFGVFGSKSFSGREAIFDTLSSLEIMMIVDLQRDNMPSTHQLKSDKILPRPGQTTLLTIEITTDEQKIP